MSVDVASQATNAGWGSNFYASPQAQNLASTFEPSTAQFAPATSDFNAAPPTTEPWNFTVSPGSISWSTNSEVDRIKIFGTNSPPVTSGTKGMRDLSLTDCLIEGFSRGVSVEDYLVQLEKLMNYSLNTSAGFVNIPVYFLRANSKTYGDATGSEGGFFVIKDIKVSEDIRDLTGNTTRAHVDVSFTQVPAYQVDSGRDQASQAVTGSEANFPEQQANQDVGKTKDKSGPAVPSSQGSKTAKTYLGVSVPEGSTNIKVNQSTKTVTWKGPDGMSYSKKGT
jgi:hypothetical protein